MIHATKADVDQAHTKLVDGVDNLNHAITMWRFRPTDGQRLRDVRSVLDEARHAFEAYDEVLRDWAAGPGGGSDG